MIVDALAGRAFINPQAEILRKYDQLDSNLQVHQGVLKSLIGLPTVTRDGVEIKLCANIGQTADALAAANVKADGVGLYRTEFVFLVQDHFPLGRRVVPVLPRHGGAPATGANGDPRSRCRQ
ncbi:putative PEP-binding protein [Candidatus Accumulibacter sp. ACC012]|uniref:putative PEP-binding protein n=1 Tax=Candidatus Accumulibacter sp. ACC012 TaxID=2823332 RepID=UPI0034274A37